MHRTTLLLLLIGVVGTHCEIWNENPQKFLPNRIYELPYTAQILSGIPTTSNQYSGFLLRASVRMYLEKDGLLQILMKNVKFQRTNTVINVDDASSFIDEKLFGDIREKGLNDLMIRELEKPFQVTWHRGVHINPSFVKDDPFWSVNIKKGFINMYNVDLMPYRHYTPLKPNSRGDFYEAGYEEGIEGVCRATYNWNKFPVKIEKETPGENVAIVMTKTRDLDDCLETPTFEYASMFASNCNNQRYNITRDIVKAETTTRINATLWKTNQFVWSSLVTSRYTFAPINANMGSISTFVRQYVNFTRIVPTDEDDTLSIIKKYSTMLTPDDTLAMRMPLEELATKKVDTKANVDLANKILNLLSEKLQKDAIYNVEATRELPILIQQFVRVLSKLSEKSLLDIHKECSRRSYDTPGILTLYHDLLPSIATKEALLTVVKTAILGKDVNKEEDVSVARRIRGFGVVNNVYFPEMISILVNVGEKATLYNNPLRRETFKTVLLTIGTLTKTYLTQNVFMKKRTSHVDIDDKLAKLVLNFYVRLLKGQTKVSILPKDELTIVLVKGIGNSGIREGMQYLEEIIISNKYPMVVKVQAIYALKNMAVRFATAVQRDLVPIIFDVTRDAEMRMAAYLVVMASRPNSVLLTSLADLTRNEPVVQVKNFMFTHMRNLATTPVECDLFFKKNVSRTLETVNMETSGLQYSHVDVMPLYGDTLLLEKGYIWTPEEFLPRSISVKILLETSDKKMKLISMGFRTQGLQNLLTKMLGPNGKLYTVEKLEDIIREYEPQATLTDSNFAFYVNMFGDDIGFWALEEELKEVLQSGFLGLRKDIFNILLGKTNLPVNFKRTTFMNGMKRIPSTIGMPISTNVTGILYTDIRGEVAFKTSLFDLKSVNIELNIRPTIISSLMLESGVDATVIKAFAVASVEAATPNIGNIKMNLVYEKENQNRGLRINIRDPTTTINPFFMKVTQRTFVLEAIPEKNQFSVEMMNMPMFFESKETIEKIIRTPYVTEMKSKLYNALIKTEFTIPKKMLTRFNVHSILQGYAMINLQVIPENNPNIESNTGTELRILMNSNYSPINTFPYFDFHLLKCNFSSKLNVVKPIRSYFSLPTPGNNKERTIFEFSVTNISKEVGRQEKHFFANIYNSLEGPVKSVKVAFLTRILNIFTMNEMKFHGVSTMSAPTTVVYVPTNPLQIQVNPTDPKTFFTFTAELFGEGKTEMIKTKTTVDMDDESRMLKERIIEKPKELVAMQPMLANCVKDLEEKFTNTPSCFMAWRYLNLLNRFNYTLEVNKMNTPMFLRAFVARLIENTAAYLQDYLTTIRLIADDEVNIKNEVTIYKKQFIISPYDSKVVHAEMLVNNALLIFHRIILPEITTFNEMCPSGDPMRNNIRSLTGNRYPTLCMVRRSPSTNSGRVLTFDKLFYDVNEVIPSINVVDFLGRLVLAQDVNNSFQVSAVRVGDRPVIQVLTQYENLRTIQIVRKSLSEVMVLINGRKVQLPYNDKTMENRVIANIERLPENVYRVNDLLRVKLPLLGLIIWTDLKTLWDIDVGPFYHSRLRGICGDFDGETLEEMKTPDCKKFYYNPSDVYLSSEFTILKRKKVTSIEEALKDSDITRFMTLRACNPREKLLPTRVNYNLYSRAAVNSFENSKSGNNEESNDFNKNLFREFGF